MDTSVLIDLEQIEPDALPLELAVSAVTMAELAAGGIPTIFIGLSDLLEIVPI